MAELAIEISKTAVEALVNKVKSAIKEEAEKWQIVERDIVFIKDEFEMMQSFLNTASRERMKNQVARTWVRQVRDLSYDTEDCIEFVLHLDTKRSIWRRLLRSNMVQIQTLLPLDQAVAQIRQLKARAEEVNQRNMRYNLIGNSGEEVQQMSAASKRTVDVFIKPTLSQEDTFDLTRLIKMEEKSLQVISVCGTGGDLGTQSVMKKAYDDSDICRMFGCRAWVKMVHPFNPQEFIRSLLLAGFYTNGSPHEQGPYAGAANMLSSSMKTTQDSILIDFMIRLKKKAYLVVIENLSSIVEWNAIRSLLPDMNNGSRIVVSTQQLEVATLCTGHPYHVWLLQEFSTEHSVYIFSKDLEKKPQDSKCLEYTCETYQEGDNDDKHWQEKHSLFGRNSEIKKLFQQLVINYGERLVVISVCGIVGVGKSFLVQAFCNHYANEDAFKFRVMINAPHPFDIMNFCKILVRCFDLTSPEDEGVIVLCWKHLEEHQCLLVIDGLRSKEDWDLIEANLISRASKSCIIVITREESIARHCATSEDAICNIQGLETDAALRLFEKEAKSHMEPSRWDSNIVEEARLLINKCGRLPKLIVALGKYLAKVPNGNGIWEAQRLNANFMNALKTRKGLDSFGDVLTWMYSTFQDFPQVLKKCIFYLSIFTQSSTIRRSRLVRRWIAEGYSVGTDSNSTVEYTEKLIHDLATLGMISQTPTVTGDRTCCQINSLFLDYIISREMEENIFFPLEVYVLRGGSSPNTHRAGQHLAIGSSWKRDKFVFDNLDFSQLRSLTVSREWRSFFVSDRMRVLRVLDLEETNVKDGDIEQIVKQLPRLKFLCLRRCMNLSCLPDSLGDLRQLETLDVRHTPVTKLPKSIRKLQKLQYLRAATKVAFAGGHEPSTQRRSSSHGHLDVCDGIVVPKGIGALIALHTLGVLNVGASNKAILNELKNLTQLHKLGVSGIRRSNIKGFFSAITGHSHLKSLSLQLDKDRDYDWLDSKITPPENLRRLKMHVHVEKFQHWSCLKALGQIRRLQILSLHFKTDHDVELQFCDRLDSAAWSTPGQFCELKTLEIACSSNLHVKFAEREMNDLELLKVHCLDGSSLQLSGIEHPPSLKHVCLKGSFDDTVKEELRRKVAQHPKKPVCKFN